MKTILMAITLAAFPLFARAQLIAIKTVPVATGDQFLIFPSQNLGMGGLSLALEDPDYELFQNPARGAYLSQTSVISTPQFYTISMKNGGFGDGNDGSAHTLPVGLVTRDQHRFGGVLVAFQQLMVSQANPLVWFDRAFVDDSLPYADVSHLSDRGQYDVLDNVFGMMTGGLQSSDERLAVGLSVLAARLNGLEGVRLLYWGGEQVDQDGHLLELRLGMTAKLSEVKTVDAVLVHHRFAMKHKSFSEDREEDETNGVGVDLRYRHFMEEGWTFGGQLTGDWQWHPKIPNYDIMQIPRDPGNSSAYNLGFGLAREFDDATIGIELIYEPIWSHTWANAVEDIPLTDGFSGASQVISAGEKTVDNRFRFNNRIVRAGVRDTGDRLDIQFGIDMHTIRYNLDQTNFTRSFSRGQTERWTEWTVSGGLALHFSALEVRYLGRLLLGTGQPGISGGICFECVNYTGGFGERANFLVAPAGDLIVDEARIVTHQFTFIVPLSGRTVE